MTTHTRLCKDCGSVVVRHPMPKSYVYLDGVCWLCMGKCDRTGFGCAKPTRKTIPRPGATQMKLIP